MRCIVDRPSTTTYVLTKTGKTTHSWPIICRHTTATHASDNDDDDYSNSEIGGSQHSAAAGDDYDDDEVDGFADDCLSAVHSINCKPLIGQHQVSIERKHLIADYNQRDYHTSTSIHHAQSDFIEAAALKVQQRFTSSRNTIVPLMMQQQQQPQQHQLQSLQQQAGDDGAVSTAMGHTTTTTTTTTTSTGGGGGGGCCCLTPSPLLFLAATLLMTVAATAMICAAIMTDHWELVRWDRHLLNRLTNNNSGHVLHWHLDERVARMTVTRE